MAWIHIDRRSGAAIQHGDMRLIPEHLVVQVKFPFAQGGFVFNSPSGMKVEMPDGQTMTRPIINMTRLAQALILGLGLLGVVLFGSRRKS